MGLKNMVRNSFISQTTQTILGVYLKIKHENPDLNERDILSMLLALRQPFWGGDFETITFKGYPAFILYDGLQVGGFATLINIWESIIIDPAAIKSQHIALHELRSMITDVISIVHEKLFSLDIFSQSMLDSLAITFAKDDNFPEFMNYSMDERNQIIKKGYAGKMVEDYVNYSVNEINKLGGKIL